MIDRRLLLVHAHPDDETIGTGATMARYAAEGAKVTLLTCTMGELGEILIPTYSGLAADRADQLGGYRVWELARAMDALGVIDHRFLGGAGRWRDSGMVDTDGNADPRAFWQCDADAGAFSEAVEQVAAVIREVRPQVMITYDEVGGYGHPDHIMAHRVAMAAADRVAEGGEGAWEIEKIYWTAMPKSQQRLGTQALKEHGPADFLVVDELPFGNADDEVTTAIDATAWVKHKAEAMRAHGTQIIVAEPFFALSNLVGHELSGVEYFRLARGSASGERDLSGRETDLFAGVTR